MIRPRHGWQRRSGVGEPLVADLVSDPVIGFHPSPELLHGAAIHHHDTVSAVNKMITIYDGVRPCRCKHWQQLTEKVLIPE